MGKGERWREGCPIQMTSGTAGRDADHDLSLASSRNARAHRPTTSGGLEATRCIQCEKRERKRERRYLGPAVHPLTMPWTPPNRSARDPPRNTFFACGFPSPSVRSLLPVHTPAGSSSPIFSFENYDSPKRAPGHCFQELLKQASLKARVHRSVSAVKNYKLGSFFQGSRRHCDCDTAS